MTTTKIKDTTEFEKLSESHYEWYIRTYKKYLGVSPLDYVDRVFDKFYPNTKDQILSSINDAPYIESAVAVYNALGLTEETTKNPYTLEEIMESGPVVRSEFRSVMNMLMQTHAFSKNRMVFQFEEGITAKLLHTDLNKVDSSFVEAPYGSMYINVPYNCEMFIPNPSSGLHRVKGLYINYKKDIDLKGVSLPGGKLDPDGYHPDAKFDGALATKSLRIMAIGEKNEKSSTMEISQPTYFMSVFLAPGDIFPQVQKMVAKYTESAFKDSESYMMKLFSFCINALLYINNPTADLQRIHAKFDPYTKGKDRSVIDKKNVGLSKLDCIAVGRTVYITSEFREQYRTGSLKSFTINAPMWMVRGHYRNQVCGVGRSQRSLIWIEPHAKGKGVEEAIIGRDYVVS